MLSPHGPEGKAQGKLCVFLGEISAEKPFNCVDAGVERRSRQVQFSSCRGTRRGMSHHRTYRLDQICAVSGIVLPQRLEEPVAEVTNLYIVTELVHESGDGGGACGGDSGGGMGDPGQGAHRTCQSGDIVADG